MFSRFARALESAHLRLGVFAGLLTLGLVATIVPDIISRSFFGVALYGMSEASVLILVAMIFLGLPAAQTKKINYKIQVLDLWLGPRSFKAAQVVRFGICVITMAALSYFSIVAAYSSTLRGEMTYAVIPFPVWPARIIIAAGFTLLAVQFAIDLVRAIRMTPEEAAREPVLTG